MMDDYQYLQVGTVKKKNTTCTITTSLLYIFENVCEFFKIYIPSKAVGKQ